MEAFYLGCAKEAFYLTFASSEFVLQVQEQRMFYHHIKCVVTDVKVCRVCKKKIGNRLESCLELQLS